MNLRKISSRIFLIFAIFFVLVALASIGYFSCRWLLSREAIVRNADRLNAIALKIQLDQETGMRGFVATHDRVFLDLFYKTQDTFDKTADDLEKNAFAVGMRDVADDVAEMKRLHSVWKSRLALPIIRGAIASDSWQLLGKKYVDRFRLVNARLDDRIRLEAQSMEQRLTWLATASGLLVYIVLMGIVFTVARLVRRSDEVNEAFEREKKMVRTLQMGYLSDGKIDLETMSSSSRMRDLSEANVIGLFSTDLKTGTIVDANRAFSRMTGYTSEELRAGYVRSQDFTPSKWREADARAIGEISTTGVIMPFEKECCRKDGLCIPVLVGGALLPGGERAICYMLDLTEQKRVKEQLRTTETMLLALLDKASQLVWMTDAEGSSDYNNSTWCEYTGMSVEESSGDKWMRALHPDDLPRAMAAWKAAVQQKAPYDIEYRLRGRDGIYRWFLTRGTPLRDESGEILRWFGTCTDIDEQKHVETEKALLAEASRILSEGIKERGTLGKIASLGLPEIAKYCQIDLLEQNQTIRTVAVAHADSRHDVFLQQLLPDPPRKEGGNPLVAIARGEITRFFEHVPQNMRELLLLNSVACDMDYRIDAFSMAVVPLVTGGRILGTIAYLYGDSERAYIEDTTYMEDLARRVALALGEARLNERERRISAAFQNAALPPVLPAVPGLSFSAVYQAAKEEALVGGDWYDAFALPDGRVVLSVGDVMGSGLAAAVTMGAVRQAIRGAAQLDADPVALLDAADRVLRSEQSDRIVTAFIAVWDPPTRSLAYESAGHPPALLRLKSGEIVELMGSGLPLGLRMHGAGGVAKHVAIEEAVLLVLYTDGVTESTRNIAEGERCLRAAIEDAVSRQASDPALVIRQAVANPQDDMAILTVWIGNVVRVAGNVLRDRLSAEPEDDPSASLHLVEKAKACEF